MRSRKSGISGQLPAQSGSNGFVNRRSTVQSRPPAQDSSNRRNLNSGRQFIAAAMDAGVSELGAHRLLRDLRALAPASRNADEIDRLAWGAL